jgi:hypothetical protein
MYLCITIFYHRSWHEMQYLFIFTKTTLIFSQLIHCYIEHPVRNSNHSMIIFSKVCYEEFFSTKNGTSEAEIKPSSKYMWDSWSLWIKKIRLINSKNGKEMCKRKGEIIK